jgi:hypothetical protein
MKLLLIALALELDMLRIEIHNDGGISCAQHDVNVEREATGVYWHPIYDFMSPYLTYLASQADILGWPS